MLSMEKILTDPSKIICEIFFFPSAQRKKEREKENCWWCLTTKIRLTDNVFWSTHLTSFPLTLSYDLIGDTFEWKFDIYYARLSTTMTNIFLPDKYLHDQRPIIVDFLLIIAQVFRAKYWKTTSLFLHNWFLLFKKRETPIQSKLYMEHLFLLLWTRQSRRVLFFFSSSRAFFFRSSMMFPCKLDYILSKSSTMKMVLTEVRTHQKTIEKKKKKKEKEEREERRNKERTGLDQYWPQLLCSSSFQNQGLSIGKQIESLCHLIIFCCFKQSRKRDKYSTR